MSKARKAGKQNKSSNLPDITINDFANASGVKYRTKKYTANVMKFVETEKNWDEKLEDLDGDFVEEVAEDGTISYVIKKQERRRKKTNDDEDNIENRPGNTYHIDIWFLISEYIRPEDIGKFACICKASYEVVCSEKFWYSLYKRYYKDVPELPEKLQPRSLLRKYSLKTSVIRALHYMYNPFIERWKCVKKFKQHPDILLKSVCTSVWHKEEKNYWSYFFKMKVRDTKQKKPDSIFELLDDISANPEEDYRILQVCCKQLIQVAPVFGLTLRKVQINLSAGLSSYKLHMLFDNGIHKNCLPSSDGISVILDPVINVLILDWWHPPYPSSF